MYAKSFGILCDLCSFSRICNVCLRSYEPEVEAWRCSEWSERCQFISCCDCREKHMMETMMGTAAYDYDSEGAEDIRR